jgi:ABC-2 type transport system permease protein
MTSTTDTAARPAEATGPATTASGTGEGFTALISDAPIPHPSLLKTLYSMLARDVRVLRRNLPTTCVRAFMQPLLFVFVFTYVIPTIGGGFRTSALSGRAAALHGGLTFSTILVPGLMAGMLLGQGIMAISWPLMMEFGWLRTIEDRALAPVPIQLLAIEKIIFGSIQAIIGGLIVFPIVLLVHAPGQAPHVHLTNPALLVLIMVSAAVFDASIGLLLGTLMEPRKMQMMFAVALLPATMLGCVYYPWAALHRIVWLQYAVLINPMVYATEGLRSVLTPILPHLPMWAILGMLCGGSVVVGYLSIKAFTRRVLS